MTLPVVLALALIGWLLVIVLIVALLSAGRDLPTPKQGES